MATPQEEAEMISDKIMEGDDLSELMGEASVEALDLKRVKVENGHGFEFTVIERNEDWKHRRFRVTVQAV